MTNNVLDVLQQARTSGENGTILILPINGSGQQPGEIQVRNGRVIKVEFGALSGKEALESIREADDLEGVFEPGHEQPSEPATDPLPAQAKKVVDKDSSGMLIRTKMHFLFSALPVVVIAALGLFYVGQINSLSSTLQDESESIIRDIAENSIRQKSIDVAEEVNRHLLEHPELKKTDFHKDNTLLSIMDDAVGETGYSVLIEAPFSPGNAEFLFLTHPNDKLISVRFEQLKKALGENYSGTRKILDRVISNGTGQSEGYYTWFEKDGSVNDKYMVISRVGNTPYIVAATTYINEFIKPIQEMEQTSQSFVERTRFVVVALVTLSILLLATIVTQYGNKISDKINNLSSIAERISKGDLTVDIEGRAEKDELGELARSVERLRMSVKIMHDRLTK